MQRLTRSTALVAAGLAVAAPAQSDTAMSDVCDAGFAKIDANGDGAIQPREVGASAKAAYAAMDADGNGAVTQAEYTDCLNAGAGRQDAAGARDEDVMAPLDPDGDGEVTRAEFMQAGDAAWRAAQEDGEAGKADARLLIFHPEAGPEALTGMGRDEYAARSHMLFTAMDRDGNDAVSLSEWTEAPVIQPDLGDVLSTWFRRADADRSGDLSGAEYEAAQMERFESARKSTETAGASTAAFAEGDVPVVYYRYDGAI